MPDVLFLSHMAGHPSAQGGIDAVGQTLVFRAGQDGEILNRVVGVGRPVLKVFMLWFVGVVVEEVPKARNGFPRFRAEPFRDGLVRRCPVA